MGRAALLLLNFRCVALFNGGNSSGQQAVGKLQVAGVSEPANTSEIRSQKSRALPTTNTRPTELLPYK